MPTAPLAAWLPGYVTFTAARQKLRVECMRLP
jgi:hypothetical protein